MKPIVTTLAMVAVLAALDTSAVAAQARDSIPQDTTIYRVPGIQVRAARAVTDIGGSSATEIRLEDLILPAAPTTADVLREIPALHVRTNSRGEAEISVRGSESRQVAVIVDGVPLTLGWDARTDVSVFPAGAITDISFTRGLSTLLQGPNVLGGVVEMSLGRRRFDVESSVSAQASVDGEGGYAASALSERPFTTGNGRGAVRFGVGWMDTPGFPLPGGVEEPVPSGDGLRLNTDAQNLSGFLSAAWESEDGPWSRVSASSFRAERGIGAEIGADEPRFWRYPDMSRTVVALSGGTGFHQTPWGRGDLEASVGVDFGTTTIDSYTSRAYDQIDETEVGDDRTTTLRLTGDHTIGSRGDVAMALTWSDINHTATVGDLVEDYQQRLSSVALETHWELLGERAGPIESLRFTVGGAWDRATTPKTGGRTSLGTIDDWGGRLGLSALVRDGRTMLHAGVSRRGRFPSLRESYSEALNRFVPNPDLGPEHLVAFETGVTTKMGSGELQIVGFRHDLSGAIRRVTLENRMRMRVNSDALESTGIEILASQRLGRVGVGGDFTVQSVNLIPSGAFASVEPENVPEASGSLWAEIPLGAGVEFRPVMRYTGTQFCQDPNSGDDVELEAGTWIEGALSKVWETGRGRGVETRVSVDNLGNTALYDSCGLPRAGRLLRFSIRVF